MHWYTDVIKKYAVFNGRAARPEFWWFALCNVIIFAVIYIVVGIIAGRSTGQAVGDLYSLAVLLPTLGVGIRRLHDTNRTGWWYLLVFIPLIGGIVLIVFWAMAGDPGPNNYGPNPQNPDRTRACSSIRRPASACPRHRGSIRRPVSRWRHRPTRPPEVTRAQRAAQRPSAGSAPICS